jgi:hypothetical protein
MTHLSISVPQLAHRRMKRGKCRILSCQNQSGITPMLTGSDSESFVHSKHPRRKQWISFGIWDVPENKIFSN